MLKTLLIIFGLIFIPNQLWNGFHYDTNKCNIIGFFIKYEQVIIEEVDINRNLREFDKENNRSVAVRYNNPGNIRLYQSKTYRTFNNMLDGYNGMKRQLRLYTSGKSEYTDSTTTIWQYGKIYATSKNYSKLLCMLLKAKPSKLLSEIPVDSLLKYQIMMENRFVYDKLYKRKTKKNVWKEQYIKLCFE